MNSWRFTDILRTVLQVDIVGLVDVTVVIEFRRCRRIILVIVQDVTLTLVGLQVIGGLIRNRRIGGPVFHQRIQCLTSCPIDVHNRCNLLTSRIGSRGVNIWITIVNGDRWNHRIIRCVTGNRR